MMKQKKIQVVKHTAATTATDIINMLILMILSFGGACSLQNIAGCYIFFILMAIFIVIKYFKIEI